MGGIGSGRRLGRCPRLTTDDCLCLDVNQLSRDGVLCPSWRGLLHWKLHGSNELFASLRCIAELDSQGHRRLRLSYRLDDGREIETFIHILTSRPHFGGVRNWFQCPGGRLGTVCARRVTKLYLRGSHFLCRHCQDLRYRSRSNRR